MPKADTRPRLVPLGLRGSQLRPDRRVVALRPRLGFQFDPDANTIYARFHVRPPGPNQIL